MKVDDDDDDGILLLFRYKILINGIGWPVGHSFVGSAGNRSLFSWQQILHRDVGPASY